jgi:hypothetical protein
MNGPWNEDATVSGVSDACGVGTADGAGDELAGTIISGMPPDEGKGCSG